MAGAGLGLLGLFLLRASAPRICSPRGCAGSGAGGAGPGAAAGGVFVMAVGFGCKAGMFPLHAWLPIAHPVGSGPASAVLSGLITKMGSAGPHSGGVLSVRLALSGWELGAAGGFGAGAGHHFSGVHPGSAGGYPEKRLAYSTVSQVSYVIFGLMLFHPMALEGPCSRRCSTPWRKMPCSWPPAPSFTRPTSPRCPRCGGGQRLRHHHVVLHAGLPCL